MNVPGIFCFLYYWKGGMESSIILHFCFCWEKLQRFFWGLIKIANQRLLFFFLSVSRFSMLWRVGWLSKATNTQWVPIIRILAFFKKTGQLTEIFENITVLHRKIFTFDQWASNRRVYNLYVKSVESLQIQYTVDQCKSEFNLWSLHTDMFISDGHETYGLRFDDTWSHW